MPPTTVPPTQTEELTLIPDTTSLIEKTSTPAPINPQPQLGLPPQGLYDSCVPSDPECLGHLDVLAAKGFKLILNYGQLYGDTKSQIAYADHAQALGMQVIWSILPRVDQPDNWMITKYETLSAESGCIENYCVINYFINLVKDHPATWGYYIADEIKPANYVVLKKWTDTIRQADPEHPLLLVTAGSNDPMELYHWFYTSMSGVADVIGPCYYPYGYIESGSALSGQTGATARQTQYWADKLGKQSVMVLQAFSQVRYAEVPLCFPWPFCAPFPSYEQMKAQRDQTILNSKPAIILWWTYQDILKTDDPQKHLDDLAAAAFAPLPEAQITPTPMVAGCLPGWICENIGNPVAGGALTQKDNSWVMQGAGWDIWSKYRVRADQFLFAWKSLSGAGEMSARLMEIQQPQPAAAKAGLMIRKTIDPVSPYYAVLVTPGRQITVQYRADFGQEPEVLADASAEWPVYLKIVRSRTWFEAFSSNDGISWSSIPGSKVAVSTLGDDLMTGLFVLSGDENNLTTASFEQVVFWP
jgi:hypothetical protein